MQRGDFVVVRTHGWAAQAIRVADAIGGTWSDYNHAGILDRDPIRGEWLIIEATPDGVEINRLAEYPATDYVVGSPLLTDEQRRHIVTYGRDCYDDHVQYGWLDIVALGAVQLHRCPTCLQERAERDDRLVCSQLVAYAYASAGHPLGGPTKDPWSVTPGFLGQLITEGTL